MNVDGEMVRKVLTLAGAVEASAGAAGAGLSAEGRGERRKERERGGLTSGPHCHVASM